MRIRKSFKEILKINGYYKTTDRVKDFSYDDYYWHKNKYVIMTRFFPVLYHTT